MKFVYEIALVQLDIKITKYMGSLNSSKSKYLLGSFLHSGSFCLQPQQYFRGAKLSVMDFMENCDAKSLGFSKADSVEPWKGVDMYLKLDVEGLRFGVFGTFSFLT